MRLSGRRRRRRASYPLPYGSAQRKLAAVRHPAPRVDAAL